MNKEVQNYIDKLPEERKVIFEKLQSLILDLYPNLEILIWFGMPTYRIKKGWVGWVVSLANHKKYITLYTNGSNNIITEFGERHPNVRIGRGCIKFKITDSIPEEDVKIVIKKVIEQVKRG